MDIELALTFLAIVDAGSFIRASEKLNVTQTTVSARVRLLESELRRPVFVRNKSGATLTPAGQQFLRFAPTLVQVWERARHEVALPAGHRAVLAVGGELSLWNPLLLTWMVWMKGKASDVALRAQVGVPNGLLHQVANGALDLVVVYGPRHLPGLHVEFLMEEELVLVTTDIAVSDVSDRDYVYVDWGEDFAARHGMSFPHFSDPGLFVGLGPLALDYILEVGGAGYFRRRAVQPLLESGRLEVVDGAPTFKHPVYAVYSDSADPDVLSLAIEGLRDFAVEDALPDRSWKGSSDGSSALATPGSPPDTPHCAA